MVNRQIDAMAELQHAFSVLFKNWVLAIPTALVAVVGSVLLLTVLAGTMASFGIAGMTPGSIDPTTALHMLATAGPILGIFVVVMILLGLLAQAVVIGGAEHVWHGQPADLMGGVNKALSKVPPLFGLFLIAAVIGFFCLLLSFILIGPLVGIVLAFMFMYTLPAIVVGNEGVLAALGTSWRLVRANFGPSALAFIGIFVAYIIGGVIEMVFSSLHLLSVVINLIVGGLTAAFAALVVVRFYDLLRGAPAS